MIRKFLNSLDLIFLSLLSFFTRFWHLSYPAKVVFDEAHFGLYATKYLSHQYYFDIHPPLGKMLLAFSGFLGKIKPGFNFEPGSFYDEFNFLALRFLPALFGSFLVLLIYFLVKELGFSKRVAFLSGFLVLFDNAFLVQSRFILMDIILVFFIFFSLYLFILIKNFPSFSFRWYFFYSLLGFSLGAALSIKWTGFGALGIVWFLSVFQDNILSHVKKENLIKIGFLFVLPLVIYFLVFVLHFYILPFSCNENCGGVLDQSLKNPEPDFFDKVPTGNLITKFFEVNKLMLFSNLSTTNFYYAKSDWFSWPFMIGPVPYFLESKDHKLSSIFFFGNPVVWWLGIIGIIGYFYLIIKNYFLKFRLKLPQNFYSQSCFFLILGYLVYFLPFASIKRYMLMYHYLPALVFSTILFSVFFEGIIKILFNHSQEDESFFFKKRGANLLFLGVLILVFLSFLYFSPLTYGLPLEEKNLQNRMWLESWEIWKFYEI